MGEVQDSSRYRLYSLYTRTTRLLTGKGCIAGSLEGNLYIYDNIIRIIVILKPAWGYALHCKDTQRCKHGKAREAQRFFRALHCPARWAIIRIIGEGEKGSGEILEGLAEAGEGLARSSLYYHLSELEEAGIIEMAGYREVGGGAPEKIWKLKTREIRVDLLEDASAAKERENGDP